MGQSDIGQHFLQVALAYQHTLSGVGCERVTDFLVLRLLKKLGFEGFVIDHSIKMREPQRQI